MPYDQGQEPGMVYAGGSANFDETTGQYRNGFNPMPKPDFSQFGPIQFQRQNQGLQQQYDIGLGGQFNPAMQMNPQQQMPQLQPPMGQYGYGRQMGQQYNPMQAPQRIPAQQDMQPQQGIVAPPPGTPNNGNIY
jgi:hypothetical protein